jgi:hypothetical protein
VLSPKECRVSVGTSVGSLHQNFGLVMRKSRRSVGCVGLFKKLALHAHTRACARKGVSLPKVPTPLHGVCGMRIGMRIPGV